MPSEELILELRGPAISKSDIISVDQKPSIMPRKIFPLVHVLVAIVLWLPVPFVLLVIMTYKPNTPSQKIYRSQVEGDDLPKEKDISLVRGDIHLMNRFIPQTNVKMYPSDFRKIQISMEYAGEHSVA